MSDESLADIQAQARNLLVSTLLLVQTPFSGRVEDLRLRAHSARRRLQGLVEKSPSDDVLSLFAQLFLARLHEAELEFDLAQTLGEADPKGGEAIGRAMAAVGTDGRALFRSLECLIEDLRSRRKRSS